MTRLDTVLNEVVGFLKRFVVFRSDHEPNAVALWIAAVHVVQQFDVFPRLFILSAERRSGKTRTFEAMENLVPNPIRAVDTSASALFRGIEDDSYCFFFDEVDTIIAGPRAMSEKAEELRAILNAGHTKNSSVLRTDGPTFKVKRFRTFAPIALAGIGTPGNYPETIVDRSIVVALDRKTQRESVERFRFRQVAAETEALRAEIAEAVEGFVFPSHFDIDYPGLTDRGLDNWLSLAALAAHAGGEWPERTRGAALALSNIDVPGDTPGVQLLNDCRRVLTVEPKVFTDALLRRLLAMVESPWHDRGLNAKSLSDLLRPYGIHPKHIRLGADTARGYLRADFLDAFDRYLPPYEDEAQRALIDLFEQEGVT